MTPVAVEVAVNAWLAGSLGLVARVLLPGAAWAWLWRANAEPLSEREPAVFLLARMVVIGVALALAQVLALATLGIYTRRVEVAVGLLTGLLGFYAGRRCAPGFWGARRRAAAVAATYVGAGFLGIMLLPQRGEWILGGWDPGIYVNQGVVLERNGALRPAPDRFFSRLTGPELEWFTRPAFNFTEAYPVVPLDRRRVLEPFFFPLTPAWIAMAQRAGGLRAATRANEFLGWLTLPVFFALARRLHPARPYAWVALTLLLLQPLWLYHLHFPTSEMLQLLLLCGIGLLLPDRRAHPVFPWLLAGLLGLAMLNRFSFLPFGALLVCVLAWLDLPRAERIRVAGERILQIGALVLGAICDALTQPTTLGRLERQMPELLMTFTFLVIIALALDILAFHPPLRRGLPAFLERGAWSTGLVAFGLLAAASFGSAEDALSGFRWSCGLVLHFGGWAAVTLALAGALLMALRSGGAPAGLKAWALFLLAATAVTMLLPEIARLLPWATRRYVEFTVPLLALLGALPVARLWATARLRRAGPTLALLLLAATLGSNARGAWRAWRLTEYDGLSVALTEAARHIGPADIVVADHFRWGTPLCFLHDKQVVNGELFFADRHPDRMRNALRVLARMAREGHPVRFLTSTETGLRIFPVPVEPVRLDWESTPWTMRETIHSPRATALEQREKSKRFRLYTWTPPDAPPP